MRSLSSKECVCDSPGVHVGLVPLDGLAVELDAHVVSRRGRAEEGGDGLLEGVGLERDAGVGLGLEALGEVGNGVGGE